MLFQVVIHTNWLIFSHIMARLLWYCFMMNLLALYDPFGVDVPLNLDITHSLNLLHFLV